MSKEYLERWPLEPSTAASAVHGLVLALSDLVHEQMGGQTSRRALLKACGIATAAEIFAGEPSHFFGSRMGEDHDRLEEIQQRYVEE